jgi:GNAT superfamily N-acetyltransferase
VELHISTHPAPGLSFEDALAVAPDGTAAVLVDGAGLPVELRGGCGHSVAWYAGTLAQAMLARLTARTGTPRQALAEAIADVLGAHGPDCRPEEGSPSSTLAAWRIGPDASGADVLEYVVLSDSSLFLRYGDGTVEEVVDEAVDLLTGPRRAEAFASLTAQGLPPAQARLEAHRRTTETLRNVEGGFWCCHVDPAAAGHARAGSVPLGSVGAVVLASDGATRLVHPFGVLSDREFVARCVSGSHDDLAAELRAAEEEFADRTRRVAVKRHDDATIVAARLRPTDAAPGDEPSTGAQAQALAGAQDLAGGQALAGAPGYAVRRAVADDVPAVVALLFADQLGTTREAEAEDACYRDAFARIDAAPGELLAVIVDDRDTIVGSFQLSLLPGLARRGSLRCQIEAVRVAAETRGAGVGAAAMRWAIEWSRAQGCSLVQLTSDKTRGDAHRSHSPAPLPHAQRRRHRGTPARPRRDLGQRRLRREPARGLGGTRPRRHPAPVLAGGSGAGGDLGRVDLLARRRHDGQLRSSRPADHEWAGLPAVRQWGALRLGSGSPPRGLRRRRHWRAADDLLHRRRCRPALPRHLAGRGRRRTRRGWCVRRAPRRRPRRRGATASTPDRLTRPRFIGP